MKLQVKAFQIKENDTLEVEPTFTVSKVKELVQERFSIPVEKQKIMYSGKQLKDEQTLVDVKIKDNDAVFVVGTKAPKPTPQTESKPTIAPVPETPANTSSASQSTPSAPVANRSAQEHVPNTPSPNTRETDNRTEDQQQHETGEQHSEDTFTTGKDYDVVINNLMEMGYDRELCVKAMRASFNNPDRAAEYLLMGIPEHIEQQSQEQDDQADMNVESEEAPSGRLNETLEMLRNSPEFHDLRRQVQANPNLLQPIMMQISQNNPELFRVITDNREVFLQMLTEGVEDHAGGDGIDETQDGQQVIRVTQEEKEAIDRLTEMGFERDLVVQAYFACEKDEQLTADFLLRHGNDDAN
ncbi:UV excision repair protein rad23 [Mycoemilia scoparia]|uniref:UV excision repair protein RAD23 n=1 Tax=Mycoemilia scoparia TaxID=417184 RepID=A0A9W8AB77_9FUNG|nr:UV excision repair protein rad23 [Mycoemilia scoparia]